MCFLLVLLGLHLKMVHVPLTALSIKRLYILCVSVLSRHSPTFLSYLYFLHQAGKGDGERDYVSAGNLMALYSLRVLIETHFQYKHV